MGPPYAKFPYYSHIFRDSYRSGMGIVWEAYNKGVPLLGVPENPIENEFLNNLNISNLWKIASETDDEKTGQNHHLIVGQKSHKKKHRQLTQQISMSSPRKKNLAGYFP